MERADKALALAAWPPRYPGPTVATGIEKRSEPPILGPGCENGDAEIIDGEVCSGFGKVTTQTDQLGMPSGEVIPLSLREFGAGVRRRRVP